MHNIFQLFFPVWSPVWRLAAIAVIVLTRFCGRALASADWLLHYINVVLPCYNFVFLASFRTAFVCASACVVFNESLVQVFSIVGDRLCRSTQL